MELNLIYLAYVVAAVGAVAIFAAMPRQSIIPGRTLLIPVLGMAAGGVVLLLSRIAPPGWHQVVFCILSVLALGGAVRVVTHPKPVYSALFFVMVVLSTAALAVLVGAEFLGAALVIVYAGAILVTYVFVIMLAQQAHLGTTSLDSAADYDRSAREPFAALAAGFVLVATLGGVMLGRAPERAAEAVSAADGNTAAIGRVLLTDFAVSVELAGVLLMVAMIGAIVLARRRTHSAATGDAYVPGEAGRHVKPF